jgi:hypothetical protein
MLVKATFENTVNQNVLVPPKRMEKNMKGERGRKQPHHRPTGISKVFLHKASKKWQGMLSVPIRWQLQQEWGAKFSSNAPLVVSAPTAPLAMMKYAFPSDLGAVSVLREQVGGERRQLPLPWREFRSA